MTAARGLLMAFVTLTLTCCSALTEFDRKLIDRVRGGAVATCGLDGGVSCDAVCGNQIMEPGETCDPPSTCPSACDDGTACTTDALLGSAQTCNLRCEHKQVERCSNGDGCCGAGCSPANDSECSASCGNGEVDPGETCDPTSVCPTDCNDGNACTMDTLTGTTGNCNVACSHQAVTACVNDDECCPRGCSADNDSDCTVSCGNGSLEAGETCDPLESCPTSCDDGNACTIDALTGSAANCNVACSSQVITQCASGDGCCPGGCDANSDADCTNTCNNAVVEPGETCDPPGSCPTSCDDGSACTIDTATGSAANCTAACSNQQITQCRSGDGCCPTGCTSNSDRDCSATCMNGVIEQGETCDPPSACPTSCDDGSACTLDTLIGSAASCSAACTHRTITQCRSGDRCCPPGCSNNNDSDCSVSCGNGVIESGETCDPILTCAVNLLACNDGNACTVDMLTGSAFNCTSACTRQTITQCRRGDGCCPPGCNANNDNDCSATCGNGALEPGETCDPQGSCPTTCNDGNSCTIDTITGSARNCNVACARQTISTCTNGDGCCPGGCNANNDNNCSSSCGNGVVERGETCDPPSACAQINCNDGVACTVDGRTGSDANCTTACTHQTITSCGNGDNCCPRGCNASNDNNCSPSCGNNVVEANETCDGNCPAPSTCTDNNACTMNGSVGSAAMCTFACTVQMISQCINGDGCCPGPQCTGAMDNDCQGCGNGRVEANETCDPPSSCPTSCDAPNSCTVVNSVGSARTCNFACVPSPITSCTSGDGCCPSGRGCTASNDDDCAGCGNGRLDGAETCDPPEVPCPSCTDTDPCTTNGSTGSAATCNLVCTPPTRITQCVSGDSCCPGMGMGMGMGMCNVSTDTDCRARCGDGVLTPPETCDPPGAACLTTCADDGDPCTNDVLSGSARDCDVVCTHPRIPNCSPDAGANSSSP